VAGNVRNRPDDAAAAKGQRIKMEAHMAGFDHLGEETIRFRNHGVLHGAGLCVIVHRSVLDAGTKDLARQALAAVVPIDLIGTSRASRGGYQRTTLVLV
jgi:hypothetical protein